MLCNIVINNLDDGAECLLSRSAYSAEVGGVVDTVGGSAAIQRCVDRLEKWADRSIVRFTKRKCRILHLGRNNPLYQCRLCTDWWGSSLVGKDSGSLGTPN